MDFSQIRRKDFIIKDAVLSMRVVGIVLFWLSVCIATASNPNKSHADPLSIADEKELSFAQPKNSAIHGAGETKDIKEGEDALKNAIACLQDQKFENELNPERTPMLVQDKQKNTSIVGEETPHSYKNAEDQKVYMDEKTYKNEMQILKKMTDYANLQYDMFMINKKNVQDLVKTYEEHNSMYKQAFKKIESIGNEIKKSDDFFPVKIPSRKKMEYLSIMDEISMLNTKSNKLKEKERAEDEIYTKACDSTNELDKYKYRLGEDTIKYFMQIVDTEEKMNTVIKCNLELVNVMKAKDGLLLMLREKELNYLKEDKKDTHCLEAIIELYKNRLGYMDAMANELKNMNDIQDIIVLGSQEVCSAYKVYYAAKKLCDQQEVDLEVAKNRLSELSDEETDTTPNTPKHGLLETSV
ncbi:hypothetical protein NERG_02280 [Nematocida ausubeli]|uniref:Uncharacterized protein n=1 Tax=Nematocida ausubeli (strain ATCC PRA-371 / ERTm2) TaxID=1913371 RepID=H8ZFA9_NEMA1|nr:hypothetical protein NERG_02280 [Nematocida ausubeli]